MLYQIPLLTFYINYYVILCYNDILFVYLQQNNHSNMSNNQQSMMLNRLKAALAEQGRTNRWLSEQLGKSENTVSR